MLDGRVTVNGIIVRELGTKSDPTFDDIRVDGRRVKVAEHSRYLLLNKPRGYVTTRSDPQKRPTVIDLLRGVRGYVYPVGRLDFDTEGLVLLTNDGELAARLTPSKPRCAARVRSAGCWCPGRARSRAARQRRHHRRPVHGTGGRGAPVTASRTARGASPPHPRRPPARAYTLTSSRGRLRAPSGYDPGGAQSTDPQDVRSDRASRHPSHANRDRTASRPEIEAGALERVERMGS